MKGGEQNLKPKLPFNCIVKCIVPLPWAGQKGWLVSIHDNHGKKEKEKSKSSQQIKLRGNIIQEDNAMLRDVDNHKWYNHLTIYE